MSQKSSRFGRDTHQMDYYPEKSENTHTSSNSVEGTAVPVQDDPSQVGRNATDVAKTSKLDMRYLVRALLKYGASDLHIKPGRPPLYRINGKLIPAKMPHLTSRQVQSVVFGILNERQLLQLEEELQIDVSFKMPSLGRFRGSVFYQRGAVSAVIRMIPFNIPKLEDLQVPAVLKELCQRPRGLVLVTGPTGVGKSTTLAAMVQFINETRPAHVLTLEDPIEFVHRDIKGSVTQREMGTDFHDMSSALYAGLRQDPDVIMVGELRNPTTIATALTAAETGHLVLSTLHTKDAVTTIERILDVFPGDQQNQVRIQLSSSLVGVVSQTLILRADGAGRVPACEVMINSPAISKYILEGEFDRIPGAMAQSNGYYKMQTLNQSLEQLIKQGLVTVEEALKVSPNPDDLRMKMSGLSGINGDEIVPMENAPSRSQAKSKGQLSSYSKDNTEPEESDFGLDYDKIER